jgi:hypothetical protein
MASARALNHEAAVLQSGTEAVENIAALNGLHFSLLQRSVHTIWLTRQKSLSSVAIARAIDLLRYFYAYLQILARVARSSLTSAIDTMDATKDHPVQGNDGLLRARPTSAIAIPCGRVPNDFDVAFACFEAGVTIFDFVDDALVVYQASMITSTMYQYGQTGSQSNGAL